MTVLHLFGGKADFGIRMDIDPRTRPHIVADAWLPPFGRDSFDVVVLDPPYVGDYGSSVFTRTSTLLRIAAWIARQSVIWFHPMWLRSPVRMRLRKGFVVCGGNRRAVRSLQLFDVPEPDRKLEPFAYFTRGPAIKYNRWLLPMDMLPLMDGLPEVKLHPVIG